MGLRERTAALWLAPVAPGFLWDFVLVAADTPVAAIAVVGTLGYGALVRLPARRPLRLFVVASAAVLLPLLVLGGVFLILIPAAVAFAVWGLRRHPWPAAAAS